MIERLIESLVQSKNEAADDVLLEALRLGSATEQAAVLSGLIRRATVRGLGGVVGAFDRLDEPLQLTVLANIRAFYHTLRECGRSPQLQLRQSAMKLIALGRLGKLSYVLSENLHQADPALSKAATEALVALARWVAGESRNLQRGEAEPGAAQPATAAQDRAARYKALVDQRGEIEATVARAMDIHRGKHGQDLLRAALLLSDWPGSKTLAILHTTKHGGQSAIVRRLQQPPASEHVEAFLLGATHGQLRSHFGVVFSHIDEAPVLDALLRKCHWLKDAQLQLCMHQVQRGVWWIDAELQRDLARRTPSDAARIAPWLTASGISDIVQDERLERLRAHAGEDFATRLAIMRTAAARKRGASVGLLRNFLNDPDERLARMAAREIARRRPPDFEGALLGAMSASAPSVRRVISRAVGQSGFEHFWQRYDHLPRATRKQAGRAMFKILPDAMQRLQRRLQAGAPDQRLKAMQITSDLELAPILKSTLLQLVSDPNAKVRSKVVTLLGTIQGIGPEVLVERLINDTDSRVRANVIEVLESRKDARLVPLLAQRARTGGGRERANAIKAMHGMKVQTASTQLATMLHDPRPDHRISGMWALRQIGWWQLLSNVGLMARQDGDPKVRRYAMTMLRSIADLAKQQQSQPKKAG